MDENALLQRLTEHLGDMITPDRRQRMEQILDYRTQYLTFVLEDMYQPHNASAVLRTCECFGIQELQVIEQRNDFSPNIDIAVGSGNWITTTAHSDAQAAIKALRANGYRIVTTSLEPPCHTPADLPLDQPLAVVFGNELDGVTDTMASAADAHVHIPMYGFTQSLNVSVSAALMAERLTQRLHDSAHPWRLGPAMRLKLLTRWLIQSVRSGDFIARHYLQTHAPVADLDALLAGT